MATQVYKTEDITLQDGTDVTLKPLTIAPLRRFMKAWAKFADANDDDDGFDVFINCSGIGLEANFKDSEEIPNLYANAAEQKKGEVLSPDYKTYLESVLDLETIYKVMDVTGGIKLSDPKAVQEALALAQAQEESQ